MKFRRKSLILYVFLFLTACLLPISSKAASPSLNKTSASVYVGKNLTLKVKNKSSKQKVTWKSSNISIASVSSKGTITGKKAGTVTITATVGSKKLKCTVKVKDVLTVDTLLIAMPRAGYKAKVKVNLALFGNVKFKISDVSIASASWGNYTGFPTYLTVTGKKKGTTYITITNTANYQTARIKVIVMANAPVSNTVTTPAANPVATHLKNKGITGSDGDKYLQETDGNFNYRIVLHKNGTFSLQAIEIKTKKTACSVLVNPSNLTSATVNCDYLYKATGKLNPSTYKAGSSINFQIQNAASMPDFEYKFAQQQNNTLTLTTIFACQTYILKPAGFSLQNLGFANFK